MGRQLSQLTHRQGLPWPPNSPSAGRGDLLFEFTICGAGSVCGADATAVVETA
jgi:hypothetical protein